MKLDKLIAKLKSRLKNTEELVERRWNSHKSCSYDNKLQTRDEYMEAFGARKELGEILDMLDMAKQIGAKD